MEVRRAVKEDAAAISEVFALSWKHAYRGMVPQSFLDNLPLDNWTSFLTDGADNEKIFIFAAEDAGKIVGGCVARDSLVQRFPDDGEVACLYLLPDYIGTGLGKRLLDAGEAAMREHGYTHSVLDVLDHNKHAIRFYKRNGYKKTPHNVYLELGNEPLRCYMMRKAL